MDASKDYYAILGILRTAEDVVVHAAYRALAQRYHPDRFVGSPQEANARMSEINESHAVLSDARLRAEYDKLRAQGPQFGAAAEQFADPRATSAEVEVFRPFAEKLSEFGHDAASISSVLVVRGMRKPAADYLAKLVCAHAARTGGAAAAADKLIGD